MIEKFENATKKHCDATRKLVLLLKISELVLLLKKLDKKGKEKLGQRGVQIAINFC